MVEGFKGLFGIDRVQDLVQYIESTDVGYVVSHRIRDTRNEIRVPIDRERSKSPAWISDSGSRLRFLVLHLRGR